MIQHHFQFPTTIYNSSSWTWTLRTRARCALKELEISLCGIHLCSSSLCLQIREVCCTDFTLSSDFNPEDRSDEPLSPEWWSESRQRQHDFTRLKKVVMKMFLILPTRHNSCGCCLSAHQHWKQWSYLRVLISRNQATTYWTSCWRGPRASARAKILYNRIGCSGTYI